MSKTFNDTGMGRIIAWISARVFKKAEAVTAQVLSIDSTPTKNSSNLVTSGGAYNKIHPAVVTSQPANGFAPNVFYDLGTITGTVTFALDTPDDAYIANHYYWTFDTSSTAPTITWPAGITSWYGGSAPTINASKHYEISVLDGVGICVEV